MSFAGFLASVSSGTFQNGNNHFYLIYLSVVFNWAKDETHWLAGAANDTYCWLKHGVYEQCDDGLITNISVDIPENKTDNDTFFCFSC
jgi:hypothetical protein